MEELDKIKVSSSSSVPSVTILYVKDEEIKKPIPRGNSFFESGTHEESQCKILS
jgi:hypothetical protein